MIERNKKNVKLAEELEKTKTEYEQALTSKNREVSLEIERIKKTHGRTKCARKERKLLEQANISYNP